MAVARTQVMHCAGEVEISFLLRAEYSRAGPLYVVRHRHAYFLSHVPPNRLQAFSVWRDGCAVMLVLVFGWPRWQHDPEKPLAKLVHAHPRTEPGQRFS